MRHIMTVNIARSLALLALAFVLTTAAIGFSVTAVQAAGWTIDPDGGGN
jgi:hypothetical protein